MVLSNIKGKWVCQLAKMTEMVFCHTLPYHGLTRVGTNLSFLGRYLFGCGYFFSSAEPREIQPELSMEQHFEWHSPRNKRIPLMNMHSKHTLNGFPLENQVLVAVE